MTANQTLQINMTGQLPFPPYRSVFWNVYGNLPDVTGAQSQYGANYLINIGVVSCSILGAAVSPLTFAVGGDLSGSLPNPVIANLQGNPLSVPSPTSNTFLRWTGDVWEADNVTQLQGFSVSGAAPSTNQNLSWNGSSWIPRYPTAGFFGTGAAGAVSYTSGSTSLSQDLYARTVSISAGATLRPNGYRIFCSVSFSCSGTISGSGSPGSNNSGGAAGQTSGGSAGAGGGTGNGSSASSGATSGNGSSGNGGAGSGHAGGSGLSPSLPAMQDAVSLIQNCNPIVFLTTGLLGAAGGASGGGDGTHSGGGGGGGASSILIASPTITFNAGSTINTSGGAGGTPGSGNCGGGGGGGGADVYLISYSVTDNSTHNFAGGVPGAGVGIGGAGTAGSTGALYILSGP